MTCTWQPEIVIVCFVSLECCSSATGSVNLFMQLEELFSTLRVHLFTKVSSYYKNVLVSV